MTLAPSGLSGFCTGIIFGIMLEIVYRINDPDICDEPDAVSSDAAARSNECCCESGSSGGLARAGGWGQPQMLRDPWRALNDHILIGPQALHKRQQRAQDAARRKGLTTPQRSRERQR